jgi:hypothetical protein
MKILFSAKSTQDLEKVTDILLVHGGVTVAKRHALGLKHQHGYLETIRRQ